MPFDKYCTKLTNTISRPTGEVRHLHKVVQQYFNCLLLNLAANYLTLSVAVSVGPGVALQQTV